MTKRIPPFGQKLEELAASFEREEHPDETEAGLAASVLEFVLNYERLRHQVSAGAAEAKAIDRQTIAKMQLWDSNDPEMSTIEKVLRRLAEGRGEAGISLLKAKIQGEAQAFSKKQASVAQHIRPSRRQPMSSLVEEFVRQDPKIDQNALFHALRRKLPTMADPPYGYSGNSFKSKNNEFLDIRKEQLGDYLYRAKKKFPP